MNLRLRVTMLVLTFLLLVGSVGLFQLSIRISNVNASTLDYMLDDLTASIERIPSRLRSSTKVNPFAGAKLFIDRDSMANRQAEAWKKTRPRDAAIVKKIASGSTAIWFGDWNGDDLESEVRRLLRPVYRANALAVVVAYNMPNRDCGEYSAGGAANAEEYLEWIRALERGLGTRGGVVILEPDAVSEIDCFTYENAQLYLEIINEAVKILKKNKNIYVYIDAGNAQWNKPQEIADRLKKANIAQADGFALNVSNFLTDDVNIKYGEQISKLVGGKHFVVDTSRNGRGPDAKYDWCNPAGRALGRLPTTKTDHPLVDAYLWIKFPGESDGECKGAPAAGQWWAEYALGLAQRAKW